jgi:hypothetical protein
VRQTLPSRRPHNPSLRLHRLSRRLRLCLRLPLRPRLSRSLRLPRLRLKLSRRPLLRPSRHRQPRPRRQQLPRPRLPARSRSIRTRRVSGSTRPKMAGCGFPRVRPRRASRACRTRTSTRRLTDGPGTSRRGAGARTRTGRGSLTPGARWAGAVVGSRIPASWDGSAPTTAVERTGATGTGATCTAAVASRGAAADGGRVDDGRRRRPSVGRAGREDAGRLLP